MKVDQPRGGGGRRGCGPPRDRIDGLASSPPCMCGYCRVFAQFPPPLRTILFFFFLLLFQRTEKSLLIPSWKTNSLSLLPGVLLRHLLNFFWSKSHSIFRFFLLKFSFLFYSVEKEGKIFEKGEKCLFYLL